jgi:hypothetical protein
MRPIMQRYLGCTRHTLAVLHPATSRNKGVIPLYLSTLLCVGLKGILGVIDIAGGFREWAARYCLIFLVIPVSWTYGQTPAWL